MPPRATSTRTKHWVIFPDDPAIDPEKSDLLAYREAMTDAAEKAHLVYREGKRPTRYQIRALDCLEYDDIVAQAEIQVGEIGQRRDRRIALLCVTQALEAIEVDGKERRRGNRAFEKALSEVRHTARVWVGTRIKEMTLGTDQSHLFKTLKRLNLHSVVLEQLMAHLTETGGEVEMDGELMRACRQALGLGDPSDDCDPPDDGTDPDDDEIPAPVEAPDLGESPASS